MPRYRKLYTKISESLDFNDMPDDFTRLLWILLLTVVDRDGRSIDNATLIKSKAFPLREDVTTEQVQRALDWYANRKMICRYQVGGRKYFYIPTFSHYQGDTSKEAESELPPPPEEAAPVQIHHEVTPDRLWSNSGATPELLQTNSPSDADASADASADAEAAAEQAAAAFSGNGQTGPPILPPRNEIPTPPEWLRMEWERTFGAVTPILYDLWAEYESEDMHREALSETKRARKPNPIYYASVLRTLSKTKYRPAERPP